MGENEPHAGFSRQMRNGQNGAVEKMKKTIAISVSALALLAPAAQANAADVYNTPGAGAYKDGPVYAPVSWAGFYAGVNGGYGWSPYTDKLAYSSFLGLSPAGGFGGGQIGYNFQGVIHPGAVLGLEADIQGSGIGDAQTLQAYKFKSNLDWFGTVRARVGVTEGAWLLYVTGGFAFGGINNEVFLSPQDILKSAATATGYVLGGGLEHKFSPAWSLKAEYQYLDLGKRDPFGLGPHYYKIDEDAFHTVRVGLNYHVLPGYEPLK
jgi:outer membrane immunogenic protein